MAMNQIVLQEGDTAGEIDVAPGDEVRIELTENPTTGFRWQTTGESADILRLESSDLQQIGGGIGAGGLRIFRFSVAGSGKATLKLELKRAWETGPPRATFAVAVRSQ
jgi:inhibitor of cysteine peptidase